MEQISSMESGAAVLRLREDALDWVEVDREVVVLDGEKDLYLGTNESGALLWRSLAGGSTRADLVNLLVDSFGISKETATRDADAFLAMLRERDLLVED